MSTDKNYIGNGRQKAGSEYITLSLCLEDLMAAEPMEKNGKHYLRAVVAKRRSSDNFGRTHTVYVPIQEDKQEAANNRLIDQQELDFHNQD